MNLLLALAFTKPLGEPRAKRNARRPVRASERFARRKVEVQGVSGRPRAVLAASSVFLAVVATGRTARLLEVRGAEADFFVVTTRFGGMKTFPVFPTLTQRRERVISLCPISRLDLCGFGHEVKALAGFCRFISMSETPMQPMPIDDLMSREILPIDVFLLVGERYLIVAKAGTLGTGLQKYKDKGVEQAYLRTTDYMHWVQLSIHEAMGEGKDAAARLKGIRKAMKNVYREIEDLGFDENSFSHAKMINNLTLAYLAKNPRLADLALKFEGGHEDVIQHSMMVSVTAAMLGVSHNWLKPGTIEKLALGGFLHDIGKTKIPKAISDKQARVNAGEKVSMSPDEILIYRSHVESGANLLASVKSVPEDVVLIVREHHELSDGSGFPRGIKDMQISPLARVVSLANVFTEELQRAADLPAEDRAAAVLERISQRQRQFNRDAVHALQRLFTGDRSKIAV